VNDLTPGRYFQTRKKGIRRQLVTPPEPAIDPLFLVAFAEPRAAFHRFSSYS
jgi:hypothetical protein